VGTVFWVGENSYGDGKRLGVKGDDAETYWVNAENVEPSEAPVSTPGGPAPDRGDRVRWKQAGATGEGDIFWVGPNRHAPGVRVGVRCDDGETRWLDQVQVEVIDAGSSAGASGAPAPGFVPSDPPPMDDEPPPIEDAPAWMGDDDDDDDGYIG